MTAEPGALPLTVNLGRASDRVNSGSGVGIGQAADGDIVSQSDGTGAGRVSSQHGAVSIGIVPGNIGRAVPPVRIAGRGAPDSVAVVRPRTRSEERRVGK